MTHLKKSDLKFSTGRYELVDYYLARNNAAHTDAMPVLMHLDSCESTCNGYEELCRKLLLDHPKEALAWLSLPEVGLLTSAACVAYIGNGERFSSPSQIRNSIGLVPRIDQSSIREHIYGAKHFGCMPERRNLVQAAWAVRTMSSTGPLTDKWNKMSARGKKGQRAAVAIATSLSSIGWTHLKRGELYNGFEDFSYLEVSGEQGTAENKKDPN